MKRGITSKKADVLFKQYGPNLIADQKTAPFYIKFLDQFKDFLTLLLIGAAAVSFLVGERVDAILIGAIVVLNALFGLYQEAKAEESIAALKKMTVTNVRVIRDGHEMEIESRYLVPGDIVFLEEGVKVAADGVIDESINLEVNESALTGESLPVGKKINDEIYSGTIVAKGRGYMIVSKTGMETKFGKIASELGAIDDSETPLQRKLKGVTKIIGIIGIVASVVVFIFSLSSGDSYFSSFLLAISLAVAIVPEGLPAVMTITLAIGVSEMAKKGSIIRKLSAIEALGSITLIATDKTGTLTTNKMKVHEVYVNNKVHFIEKLPTLENKEFKEIVLNGILCSTASLVYVHDHGRWDVLGDPTEGALLYLAKQVGLEPEKVKGGWNLLDEMSFDSVTKRMVVVVQEKVTKETRAYVKGAPESILAMCSSITSSEKHSAEKQLDMWARKGLRILAFAYGVPQLIEPAGNQKLKRPGYTIGQSLATNFQFLGMVAIHDAPRPEVTEAVRKAKEAGIKIVMITGDNERTAEAVGVMAGIITGGDDIITGTQLDTFSDKELLKILPKVRIFARTSPFQKHRIVKLYQELGEVVAVTGDGVNDTIALKQADVGVAMGLVGTDVARETADMVITDDNFASIVNAVEEGRNIIKNIKNAIKYLLSCNVAEALSLIVGLILGVNHLFIAIQLLYINLVTDGLPALAISFSPRDRNIMQKGVEKNIQLLGSFELRYILTVGMVSSVAVLAGYYLFSPQGDAVGKAAAFSILTLIQSFIFIDLWLSHRPFLTHLKQLISPVFAMAFAFPFIGQIIILSFPFFSRIFKVPDVGIDHFLIFAAISFTTLLAVEGLKNTPLLRPDSNRNG